MAQSKGIRIVIQLPEDGAENRRASMLVSQNSLSVIRRFDFTGYSQLSEEARTGVFKLAKLQKQKLPNFELGPKDEWTPDKDLYKVGKMVNIMRTPAKPVTGEIVAIGPIMQGTQTLLETGQFLIDVGAGRTTGVICSASDIAPVRKKESKPVPEKAKQSQSTAEEAQLSLF